MKKTVSLLLAFVMVLSLGACGGGKDKKAFDAAEAAYKNVNAAYEITAEFGSDVYEAWRLAIYDKKEVQNEGYAYLAKKLDLSKEEVLEGAAYALADIGGDKWEECTKEEKTRSCFVNTIRYIIGMKSTGGLAKREAESGKV